MKSTGGARAQARLAVEDGYAMAALLVAMSVMAIMLTVVMPVWKQMAQREKEAELIFRGEQYARAIGLFQRKSGPGTLPPNIDLLVQQRFLRRKYKDPITNDDFLPLLAGQAVLGAQPSGAARGAQPPIAGAGGGGRAGGPSPAGGAAGIAARPGQVSGGIMGVASKSTDKSIRLYNSRSRYNEWAFLYVAPTPAPGQAGAAAPAGRGQGGAGGAGGRGGTGGPGGRGGPQGPGGPSDPFGRGGPPGGGRSGIGSFGIAPPQGPPQAPPSRSPGR